MSSWQPIETVPKDGTEILIYEPPWHLNFPHTIYAAVWSSFHDSGTWTEAGGAEYMTFERATHWMPLPQPPNTGE
jgi:hypothetical protein